MVLVAGPPGNMTDIGDDIDADELDGKCAVCSGDKATLQHKSSLIYIHNLHNIILWSLMKNIMKCWLLETVD